MRLLRDIAKEIERDWGNGISHYARPYLDAMKTLNNIGDKYYHDTGAGVVLYFLANARSWKGETARRVKWELLGMVKEYNNAQE